MGDEEIEVGKVFKYFSKAGVAAVKLTDVLKRGDWIRIHGNTTDFMQTVEEMEIDRSPVEEALKGVSIGLKVKDRVRPNDKVLKLQ